MNKCVDCEVELNDKNIDVHTHQKCRSCCVMKIDIEELYKEGCFSTGCIEDSLFRHE